MHRCLVFKMLLKGFFILAMVLFILSGCRTDNDPENIPVTHDTSSDLQITQKSKSDEIIIVLVPKSLDNPIFLDAKEASEKVARELGIRVEWLGSMQSDPDEQVAIVETLIRRQVSGIIVSCLDPEKMEPVINKAVEAGIKVATFDSDSTDSDRLFYCGTNNYAAGYACGNTLISILKEKDKLDEEIELLIMTSDEGSFNMNERLRGFMKPIKDSKLKYTVVDTLYCRDDINLAGGMLEKYIRRNRNVDVFFSTGGWPLIVPYESLQGFQRWCKNGGTSIVIDTHYPIVNAAMHGLADALVGQDFKKMGELSTRALYKAIKGEQIDFDFIDTGLEYGNKDNFERIIKDKRPWEIK